MNIDRTIIAPATKGQPFGTVNISLDGKLLAKRPLVALQDVPEGGIVTRLKDNLLMLFE